MLEWILHELDFGVLHNECLLALHGSGSLRVDWLLGWLVCELLVYGAEILLWWFTAKLTSGIWNLVLAKNRLFWGHLVQDWSRIAIWNRVDITHWSRLEVETCRSLTATFFGFWASFFPLETFIGEVRVVISSYPLLLLPVDPLQIRRELAYKSFVWIKSLVGGSRV